MCFNNRVVSFYFEGLLLDKNQFKVENLKVIGEFLLTSVLDTKSVQIANESFSDLIYYLMKDNFILFTSSSENLHQNKCSHGKSVSIRAAKSKQGWINGAHKAYFAIVIP